LLKKVLKKKNVVEKFRNWFKRLPVTEQRDLYDILALLRGPDTENYKVKDTFTCRIRHILGVVERPGDTRKFSGRHFLPYTNSEPFDSYEGAMDKAEELCEGHYLAHAKEAIKRLHDLGILE